MASSTSNLDLISPSQASKEATAKLMQEGAKEAATSVRGEIDVALRRVAGPVRDARRIGALNVAASCITCLAAAIALWAVVH
jgi:hypothetical protein